MAVPPTHDLAGLLAEDRWMRQLARRLAADPHAAEDLAQEAWVAALSSGGGARRRRAWLGGVVRNLWRDLVHLRVQRARREERAARAERLPSSGELVEELELRKQVATALCELEEPYRHTLTLRFFHDRSLREIAGAEGLSIAAIHEREQRGLARLRARLARTSRGESESWAVALFALARPRGWIGAGLETIAMASAWKLGTAAAVLVGGGLAWWWRGEEREGRRAEPVAARDAEHGPVALVHDELSDPAPAAREALGVEVRSPAPAAPVPAPARLAGRVCEPSGAPVAGARLVWVGLEQPGTTSASDGRFELELPAGVEAPSLLDFSGERGIRCADVERITLLAGLRDAAGDALVLVAPRTTSAGVVLGEHGEAIPGATVAVRVRDSVFRELGVPRPTQAPLDASGASLGDLLVRSDQNGEFRLESVPGGAELYLAVDAAGYLARQFELTVVPDLGRVLTLTSSQHELEFFGVVLTESGVPVEGARVSFGGALVTTDGEGRFRIASGGQARYEADNEGRWSMADEARELEVIAVHPGHQPARLALAEHDPSQALVLTLGPPPLAIRGRVVDSEGRPRAGVQVWPRDPTSFGTEERQVAENVTAAFSVTIEDVLRGGYARRGTRSDADGRFELGGLLPRTYALWLFDPTSAERAGPFETQAGREGVELVLAGAECAYVAGRIVSAAGVPLAGVEVRPQSARSGDAHDSPPSDADAGVVTDAEGRFDFERLVVAGTTLELQHPRLLFRSVSLAGRSDLEHLELVEPVLCELQVDLTREPEMAHSMQVLDAAGEPLQLMESFGTGFMMGTHSGINGGLSEVLSVNETAMTLVLLKNDLEVLRRTLTLDPEQRTVVRP